MGRLPITLGLILVLVGAVGAAISSWPASQPAMQGDRLLQCGPGEQAAMEPLAPKPGAPPELQLVCVDRQGARRIVGEGSPQAVVGEVLGRLGWLVYSVLFALLAGLGLLLILLGLIARRRPRAPAGAPPP